MKRLVVVASVLALSACATPETRVRTALMDAGLSQPMSACMADRMVDRLSLIQLNKLSGLKKLRGADMRKLSVDEFLRRTRSLQDPEILSVVTSSGLICAVKA
jgi:type IV pilus biogenesis protein CpaD/CtpE